MSESQGPNPERDALLAELAALRAEQSQVAALRAEQSQVAALRAERDQLARRLRFYEGLVEELPCGIVHVGPDHVLLLSNAQARAHLGLDVPEGQVRNVADYGPRTIHEDGSEFPPQDYPVVACLETGEPAGPTTIGVRQLDGSLRWAQYRAVPAPDGPLGGAVVHFVDITQRKVEEQARRTLEERLRHTDRLAAMGTLAAGIAHEVNNPLTFVFGNLARVLETDPTLTPETRRLLGLARDGAARAADIVRGLGRFARVDPATPAPFDLHAALDVALSMTRSELMHRAIVDIQRTPTPLAYGIEGQAVQAMVNVLMNALQAFHDLRDPANRITVGFTVAPTAVAVTIADNGPGMSCDALARATEPFFTTKPPGLGVGLGLSVTKALMAGVGGTLELESALGAGTRVTLRFQRPPEAAAHQDPAQTTAPARDALEVLVIDDEPDICELLSWALRHHRVTVCFSGREALPRLGERPWDVILCDLMMREVGGVDVYQAARAKDPALARRVVFMTGGAFTEEVRSFLDTVPNRRLAKPFALDEVARLVERAAAEG